MDRRTYGACASAGTGVLYEISEGAVAIRHIAGGVAGR
jgi:hypothetical protein